MATRSYFRKSNLSRIRRNGFIQTIQVNTTIDKTATKLMTDELKN